MRNPVGMSKIHGWRNRWSVCYSDGTQREISILWNIAPDNFRSWYCYRRHIKVITFDQLIRGRKNV
jgi:hypothetical protein